MESNKIVINIVLWAYEISKANEIAQKFSQSSGKNNVYSFTHNGIIVNIFLRSPRLINLSSPSGITNILFIYLSGNESEEIIDEAKNYLDVRKKIPLKLIISENDVQDKLSLKYKFLNIEDLLSNSGKDEILKEARIFEETLLNCFKKFDIKGNGLISCDELIKVSLELGHDLQYDDAKMIVDTLDKKNPGKISFDAFKQWWVLRKSDFINFRRICKAEIYVNDFIKTSTNKFKDYLANLKNEGKEITQEELNQSFNINIHSKEAFENGLGIFFQFCNAREALDIIETKFEEIRHSGIAFSLKFKFDSNEIAIRELENVKKFCYALVLNLTEESASSLLFFLGPIFKYKVSENYVIGYINDYGPKLDTILGEFKGIFSGTLHLFSEVNFDDFLNLQFNEFLEKFLRLKIHLNSNIFQLRETLSKIINNIQEGLELSEIEKYVLFMIRAYSILRKVNLDLSFKAADAKNIILNYCDNLKTNEEKEGKNDEDYNLIIKNDEYNLKSQIVGIFNTFDFILYELRASFEEMKRDKEILRNSFIEEHLSFLNSVDMSKLEIDFHCKSVLTPIYAKLTINLPKLNEIRDLLLKV